MTSATNNAINVEDKLNTISENLKNKSIISYTTDDLDIIKQVKNSNRQRRSDSSLILQNVIAFRKWLDSYNNLLPRLSDSVRRSNSLISRHDKRKLDCGEFTCDNSTANAEAHLESVNNQHDNFNQLYLRVNRQCLERHFGSYYSLLRCIHEQLVRLSCCQLKTSFSLSLNPVTAQLFSLLSLFYQGQVSDLLSSYSAVTGKKKRTTCFTVNTILSPSCAVPLDPIFANASIFFQASIKNLDSHLSDYSLPVLVLPFTNKPSLAYTLEYARSLIKQKSSSFVWLLSCVNYCLQNFKKDTTNQLGYGVGDVATVSETYCVIELINLLNSLRTDNLYKLFSFNELMKMINFLSNCYDEKTCLYTNTVVESFDKANSASNVFSTYYCLKSLKSIQQYLHYYGISIAFSYIRERQLCDTLNTKIQKFKKKLLTLSEYEAIEILFIYFIANTLNKLLEVRLNSDLVTFSSNSTVENYNKNELESLVELFYDQNYFILLVTLLKRSKFEESAGLLNLYYFGADDTTLDKKSLKVLYVYYLNKAVNVFIRINLSSQTSLRHLIDGCSRNTYLDKITNYLDIALKGFPDINKMKTRYLKLLLAQHNKHASSDTISECGLGTERILTRVKSTYTQLNKNGLLLLNNACSIIDFIKELIKRASSLVCCVIQLQTSFFSTNYKDCQITHEVLNFTNHMFSKYIYSLNDIATYEYYEVLIKLRNFKSFFSKDLIDSLNYTHGLDKKMALIICIDQSNYCFLERNFLKLALSIKITLVLQHIIESYKNIDKTAQDHRGASNNLQKVGLKDSCEQGNNLIAASKDMKDESFDSLQSQETQPPSPQQQNKSLNEYKEGKNLIHGKFSSLQHCNPIDQTSENNFLTTANSLTQQSSTACFTNHTQYISLSCRNQLPSSAKTKPINEFSICNIIKSFNIESEGIEKCFNDYVKRIQCFYNLISLFSSFSFSENIMKINYESLTEHSIQNSFYYFKNDFSDQCDFIYFILFDHD